MLSGDTVDTLHERIKSVERTLYPDTIAAAVAAIAAGESVESIAMPEKIATPEKKETTP